MNNQNRNEIALRLGNYLRRQLNQNGLTVSDVAEQLGYSERQIRRWVNGQASRFDTVEQIAFLFDVSVWDVLADDDEDIPFNSIKLVSNKLWHLTFIDNLY